MPAFQFDSSGIDPQYGGSGSQLPLGKHPVVIVGSNLKPTRNNDGGYLELTLEAIDGPSKGVQHSDRLNLHNKSAQAVEIANKQLSAYCHVTGVLRFQSTEELHNKPFVVEIGPEPDDRNPNRTGIKKLFDINGNEPGHAGAGGQGGNAGAFGGGQPQGGQGGGAWGGGQPNTGGQPQGQPQGGGNAWGGANGGQNGGQPQGGGAAPSGQGGGWSQGQGGGQPGWGAR